MAAANPSQALAACAAASTAKYPTAVKATPGLIGYWRLNETSGTQACDAHGTHHGTYAGSMLLAQGGALSDLDPSAAFDGASTGVRVPNALQLSPLAVSIEAWVNTTDITKEEQTIARKQGQYSFQVTGAPGYTNGNLKIRIYKPGGSYDEVQWGAFNGGNVWRHVVATFDGSAMRVYSNGVLVASKSMSGSLPSTTSDLMIGRTDNATEPDHMQGRIDDVSIYSRALTADEVKDHYEKSAPETVIGSGPASFTNSGSATLAFSSPDAATTSFECKVDSEPWATCTTPKSYANLGDGKHTFSTRAKTAAGYVDVTPATRTWRVERLAMLDPDTLHADGAEVIWTPFHDSGFTAYEVHRSLSSTYTPSATTLLARITEQTTTRYRDTSAAPATSFTYKLVVNGTESGTRTVTLPADGEATKTLQPGPETGRGAWFYTGWNCSNTGDGESLKIGRPLDNAFIMRSVLAFDVSDIPADATIHSASLALRAQHTPGETTTFNLHRVTTAWEEGDERDDCDGPGVSWVNASAGTPWTTPGGDYDPVAAASITKPANAAHGWDTYSLTTLVRQWVKGEVPNLGMLFKLADEAPGTNKVVHYAADDYTYDITRRPKLTVSYRDGSTPVKPTVAVSAPSPASELSGIANVSAEVGDDRRVDKVQFYSGTTPIGAEITSPPFTLAWNTTAGAGTAQGAHSLTAKATDDAGNTTTSAAVAVTVDNTNPPAVSITNPAASYQAAVLDNSPAAYWRLGETTGTNAADASGNNRNGTFNTSVTLNAASLILGSTDPSATFKNASPDGNMSSGGLSGLIGTNLTAEAWVNYSTLMASSPDNYVVSRGWGSAGGWNLVVFRSGDGSQRAGFQVNKAGSVHGIYVPVTPGRLHLAGTFDGATLKLYVNGALAGSGPLTSAPLNTTSSTLVGNTLQSDLGVDEVAVYGTALSATDLKRHYVAGAGIKGTETIKATATDDTGIAKVEFLVNSNEFGSATSSPYEASLNTLALKLPDGKHEIVAKATDTRGKTTLSSPVSVHVSNLTGTKYDVELTTTAGPPSMVYDPAAVPPDTAGFEVTLKNNATTTLADSTTKLRWRWIASDGTVAATSSDISIGGDLAPGATRLRNGLNVVKVTPPALPNGVDRQDYTLRFDLWDSSASAWFADKGMKPADHLVTINRKLTIGLGLERYYQYDSEALGAGMSHLVNLASGNSIVRFTPWAAPGRGLAKVVDLTYNTLESHSRSPVGNNFSLSISSLTRLGARLDIHPNKADQLGKATPSTYVEFMDGDGTTHRFDAQTLNGTVVYVQPAGVHLYLRPLPAGDTTRAWALTRPDRVTYFFNDEGYPTFVRDGNGNEIKFILEDVPPGDDPGGPKKRVKEVRDAGDQKYVIDYYTKAETKDAQIRGRVERLLDHDNSELAFRYYADGNLMRIIERGGTAPDGTVVKDRSFLFVYTTNTTSLPPSSVTDLDNPPQSVPNQSTRLHSVRDPNLHRTTFGYLDTGGTAERSKIVSRTNRLSQATQFAYDPLLRKTTVTPPVATGSAATARQVVYQFDTEGKVTEVTEPLNTVTKVAWANRHVAQVTEPSAAGTTVTTKYEYDHNGYLTASVDQLNRRSEVTYDYFGVDANDVTGKWANGRSHGHISQLKTRKDAALNVWTFGHDLNGNLTSVDEPGPWPNITHAYLPNGNLDTSTSQDGTVTKFEGYDAAGQPAQITENFGGTNPRVTKFAYTADGLLRAVTAPRHAGTTGTDERQFRSVMEYDPFHRLARQSTPKGDVEKTILYSDVEYDPNDNVTAEFAPHEGPVKTTGTKVVYEYDWLDRATASVGPTREPTGNSDEYVSPVADANGNALTAPQRTEMRYDNAGRMDRMSLPMATSGSELHRIGYDFDDLDRVKRTTRHETGTKVLYEHKCYDAAGNLESVTAPKAGVTTVDCALTTRPSYTSRFQYFADHQIKQTTDPESNFVLYGYNAKGELESVTDEENRTTKRFYDVLGRVIKIEEPFRTGDPAVTQFVYDKAGRLKWEFSPRAADFGQTPVYPTSTTDVDSSIAANASKDFVTGYDYDALGQVTRIQSAKDANTPRSYTHRTYDADGNVSAMSIPVAGTEMPLDPSQPATAKVPHPDFVHTQSWFDTGWLKQSRTPASVATVSFDYTPEGWQRLRHPSVKDEGVREREWRYFADGSVKKEIAADGQISLFTYDLNGNPATGRDDSGASQVKGQSAELEGTASDPLDFNAIYDALGRLKEVRQQPTRKAGDSSDDWTVTQYAYDDNGNVAERIDNVRRLNAAYTGGRKSTYTYDFANRFATFRDHGPNSGQETSSNGDPADDRLSRYEFFKTGAPKTRTTVRPPAPAATPPRATESLVQKMEWSYFANDLMQSQITRNSASQIVEQHTLSYIDGSSRYHNGHALSDQYTLSSANTDTTQCRTTTCTTTYEYDAQDRLKKEIRTRGGTLTTEYELNAAGSILKRKVNSQVRENSVYKGPQLETSVHTFDNGDTENSAFFYDTAGRLKCVFGSGGSKAACDSHVRDQNTDGLREYYDFDAKDRLRHHETWGPGATRETNYRYDVLDRLVSEQQEHEKDDVDRPESRKTLFSYNGLSNDVVKEEDVAVNTTSPVLRRKGYTYDAGGGLMGMTDAKSTNGTMGAAKEFSYATDPHGSVSLLLTDTGGVQASYSYNAYGEADSIAPDSRSEAADSDALTRENDPHSATPNTAAPALEPLNSFRYSSKRFDTGSATTDMGARRFTSKLGAFLSEDYYGSGLSDLGLTGDALTANRYSLAGGNPVSFVESDGHEPKSSFRDCYKGSKYCSRGRGRRERAPSGSMNNPFSGTSGEASGPFSGGGGANAAGTGTVTNNAKAGKAFEGKNLRALGLPKNNMTYGARGRAPGIRGVIPDATTGVGGKVNVFEVKLNSYAYLSRQIQREVNLAESTGGRATLILKRGARVSNRLKQRFAAGGHRILKSSGNGVYYGVDDKTFQRPMVYNYGADEFQEKDPPDQGGGGSSGGGGGHCVATVGLPWCGESKGSFPIPLPDTDSGGRIRVPVFPRFPIPLPIG